MDPRRFRHVDDRGATGLAPLNFSHLRKSFALRVFLSSRLPPMRDLPPVLDARGLELVGHSDLGGKGDGMQIMRNGDVVYVGHMGDFGVGTSVVDVSDLTRPRVITQLPAPARTHAHKTQYADGLLLVNNERYPYDASDPESTGVGSRSAPLIITSRIAEEGNRERRRRAASASSMSRAPASIASGGPVAATPTRPRVAGQVCTARHSSRSTSPIPSTPACTPNGHSPSRAAMIRIPVSERRGGIQAAITRSSAGIGPTRAGSTPGSSSSRSTTAGCR